MIRRASCLLLSLLMVTGCATLPVVRTQAQIEQALADLAETADEDLAQALTLTPAQDIEAATCWAGLRPIVAELKAAKASGQPLLPQPKGVFSGFQIVRNGVRAVLGAEQTASPRPTLLARINVACGPLVASADVDALRLALKGAGDVSAAATGIGALPAALRALHALKVLLPVPVPLG